MIPPMTVGWSSKASNDLTHCLNYTRERRSITKARQRLTLIESTILHLAQWPDSGRATTKKNIRVFYAPAPECKFYYRMDTHEHLTILRIEPDSTQQLRASIDF